MEEIEREREGDRGRERDRGRGREIEGEGERKKGKIVRGKDKMDVRKRAKEEMPKKTEGDKRVDKGRSIHKGQ